MENRVYISVSVMGTVNQVLGGLIEKIESSGLSESAKIIMIVNGDASLLQHDLSKYEVVQGHPDVSRHEFPALSKLWVDSKKEDFRALYLHTKGVSRPYPQVQDWTEYMSYFNIEKWRDRLEELKENDTTGVNNFGNPDDIRFHPMYWGYGKTPVHYGGNFWWANSSHISQLTDPYRTPDADYGRWRMMCEMWICQRTGGRYHCAYNSNVDHYQTRYPREMYAIES
jgi:hypothetical protein